MKLRLSRLWHFVRTLTREDAYEAYLAHHRQTHSDRPALDRREFYLREQQRKWSGVTRCC